MQGFPARAASVLLAAWLAAPCASAQASGVVADGRTVGIAYTLSLDDGSVVGTNVGGDPLVYEQGAGLLLAKLESALAGLGVGDRRKVHLEVADAYGPVDPDAVAEVPLDRLPPDAVRPGAVLAIRDGDGNQRHVRVLGVDAGKVRVDLNHPLAGKALTFDVEILSVE